MSEKVRVGIIGARGFVGRELIQLIGQHPRMTLAFVSSREREGRRLDEHETGYSGDLRYVAFGPSETAQADADAVVLALPNGQSPEYVKELDRLSPTTVIVDLSADHRFDGKWHYGLRELAQTRATLRVSNPGCYATACQLALAPLRELLEGPAQCFGVSGWSGSGTTPSDRNDPDKLRDNLLPYSLTGHLHEREVTLHLGHPIELMPHVAPHFRGLSITANAHLSRRVTMEEVRELYRSAYHGQPLVRVREDPPWTSRVAGRHYAEVGGFSLSADGRRMVVVSVLDNLLKGAATQAIQNLNSAFSFDDNLGIPESMA